MKLWLWMASSSFMSSTENYRQRWNTYISSNRNWVVISLVNTIMTSFSAFLMVSQAVNSQQDNREAFMIQAWWGQVVCQWHSTKKVIIAQATMMKRKLHKSLFLYIVLCLLQTHAVCRFILMETKFQKYWLFEENTHFKDLKWNTQQTSNF